MNLLKRLQIRGFVAGMLFMAMLSAVTVFAVSRTEVITVSFSNIRLVINGEHVTPRNADGQVVEPFIWEGTTYLPIRAIGDALGMEVDWNPATATAYLTDAWLLPAAPPPTQPQITQALVGTWYWNGLPYYIFEQSGLGAIEDGPVPMSIHWSTRNNVLSICTTPHFCLGDCTAPTNWHYALNGNDLTLTRTDMPGMTFNYTRQ